MYCNCNRNREHFKNGISYPLRFRYMTHYGQQAVYVVDSHLFLALNEAVAYRVVFVMVSRLVV